MLLQHTKDDGHDCDAVGGVDKMMFKVTTKTLTVEKCCDQKKKVRQPGASDLEM